MSKKPTFWEIQTLPDDTGMLTAAFAYAENTRLLNSVPRLYQELSVLRVSNFNNPDSLTLAKIHFRRQCLKWTWMLIDHVGVMDRDN